MSRSQKLDFSEINVQNYWALVGCLLLTPINWYFEWIKWKRILKKIDEKDNPNNSTAFASGIISSFLTPSLSGNFLGRMLYYDKSKRWKITILSTISNLSQFLVALIFGVIALSILNESQQNHWKIYIIIPVLFIFIILYFFGERLAAKIPINQVQLFGSQIEKDNSRSTFLLISMLRYVIFVSQYVLALKTFGIIFSFETIYYIMLVFLFVTLTPSLFFGKIMVRESIAVTIFGMAGYETIPIIFASFTTWFFNLFLAAFVALLIVKKTIR
jgi:MFS family permease